MIRVWLGLGLDHVGLDLLIILKSGLDSPKFVAYIIYSYRWSLDVRFQWNHHQLMKANIAFLQYIKSREMEINLDLQLIIEAYYKKFKQSMANI